MGWATKATWAMAVHCTQPRWRVQRATEQLYKTKSGHLWSDYHINRKANIKSALSHRHLSKLRAKWRGIVIPDMTCKQGPQTRPHPKVINENAQLRDCTNPISRRHIPAGNQGVLMPSSQLYMIIRKAVPKLVRPRAVASIWHDIIRGILTLRCRWPETSCNIKKTWRLCPLTKLSRTWCRNVMSGPVGRPRRIVDRTQPTWLLACHTGHWGPDQGITGGLCLHNFSSLRLCMMCFRLCYFDCEGVKVGEWGGTILSYFQRCKACTFFTCRGQQVL